MNRIRKLLLSLAVAAASLFAVQQGTVPAVAKTYYDLYPMSCSAYEVDYVTENGTFAKVGCYNDLGAAKTAMFSVGDDGVIRHKESFSPTKIIMMTSGVVYSYPQRSKSNTGTIYQYMENIYDRKTTYVTVHREMAYEGTYTYNGDGTGWVRVMISGFDGYMNLKDMDLVPMRFITDYLPLYLGGNSTYDGEEPFSMHVIQGYYRVEQNGNYLDLVYYCSPGWSRDSWPIQWKFVVGKAADWMMKGATYFSNDGYTFYNDRKCTDSAGVYYNYYQFVPLRTRSTISADTYNRFLSAKGIDSSSKLWDTGEYFLEGQDKYGMNAMLVFALACLESAYGTSDYAINRNNLFGWTAYDSDPNSASWFPSVKQAIMEQMGINLRSFVNIKDWRYFGSHLGNKGSGINVKYAGDNYWGMKIAAIAYEFDKFANDYDGNLTDWDSAATGIIKDNEMTSICTEINGPELYYTRYGPTYQMNHTVAIVSEADGWYEVQSTSYLSGTSVTDVKNTGLLVWDWQNYTGWISADKITRTNTTVPVKKGTVPTGDPVLRFDALTMNGTQLSIRGKAYTPGIYVTEDNTVQQVLKIQDMNFADAAEQILASSVLNNDEVSFNGTIDAAALPEGNYFLMFTSGYALYPQYAQASYVNTEELPAETVQQGRVYFFERNGDAVVLKIRAVDCGSNAHYDEQTDACTCNEGFQDYVENKGCTVVLQSPEPTQSRIMQSVESVETAEDGKVNISGVAYFDQVNAPAGGDAVITLLLVDMESGQETELETVTLDLETPIDFHDGYDYTRAGYTAMIDPAAIPEGNYYLRVRVQNGDYDATHLVISNKESMDQEEMEQDGLKFRFYASPMSNFRLEVSKEVSGLDRSLIRKPTRKASVYAEEEIRISEDAVLYVKGSAFIANTYINEENHPEYTMILEDEAGALRTYTAQNDGCAFDYAAMRNSRFTIMDSCFTAEADLHDLPDGTYRLLLDLKTDEARDIFSLYNYRPIDVTAVTYENRSYTIVRSKVHDRYLLIIEEIQQ